MQPNEQSLMPFYCSWCRNGRN